MSKLSLQNNKSTGQSIKPLKTGYGCLLVSIFLLTGIEAQAASNTAIINDPGARTQYSMGYFLTTAEELKDHTIDINAVMMGVKDRLADQLQLSPDEIKQTLNNLGQSYLQQKNTVAAKTKAYREKNLVYLQKNKQQPGIITTDSGLQYLILTEGDGPSPGINDEVTVHYKGSLINGQVFESSYRNDQAANFAVNSVIKGWSEALQLMRSGSQWRLFIPASLAYTDRGIEHRIPPDSTLILDVELLAIN